MGGIVEVEVPKPTREEIYAHLIEIGKNVQVPDPHTVLVVEDPHFGRTTLDEICYAIPVGHLEKFPYATFHLQQYSITFYHYKDKDAAVEDAMGRLARK